MAVPSRCWAWPQLSDLGQVAEDVGLDLMDLVAPDEPMDVDPYFVLLPLEGFDLQPLEGFDFQFLEGFGQGAEDPDVANLAPHPGSPGDSLEEELNVSSLDSSFSAICKQTRHSDLIQSAFRHQFAKNAKRTDKKLVSAQA